MPPTPALSRAHALRVCPLRRSLLVRGTLYALLFMLLTCLGDQRHAPDSPARLAAASSEAPLPAEGSDGENLDSSESPDHCHGPRLGQTVSPQSSARVPLPAVTALSLTDATATAPLPSRRRPIPRLRPLARSAPPGGAAAGEGGAAAPPYRRRAPAPCAGLMKQGAWRSASTTSGTPA
ncbi:hypothetical protein GCM10010307_42700 [Streptomyces vastus]|uniref:Uncharacterized protein n=1 Tax=Streptomyces vastus TaxID=285451 RepID=A0ABN3R1K9_9ACTN